jgi:hypothetical protein
MIKRIFCTLLLSIGMVLLPAGVAVAQSPFDPACGTGVNAGNSTVCKSRNEKANPITGKDGVLARGTRLIAVVAGVAAVIGIIVGGIRFITASGDPNGISGARNTILFSVIGLIIVVLAQGIVVFVLNRL